MRLIIDDTGNATEILENSVKIIQQHRNIITLTVEDFGHVLYYRQSQQRNLQIQQRFSSCFIHWYMFSRIRLDQPILRNKSIDILKEFEEFGGRTPGYIVLSENCKGVEKVEIKS